MIGVLILTHGSLATELLSAARTISGELHGFKALALDWSDGYDEAHTKLEAVLPELDSGEGVLILTDIYGGTPSNVALSFCDDRYIEVVSGVNLPMVVRLGCLVQKAMPLDETAAWIRDKGRQSIVFCGEKEQESARRKPYRRIRDET